MALNHRQRAFVAEFAKDRNATQAAIRAGYSEKGARTRGSLLLADENIKAAIEEMHRDAAQAAGVTLEWVISSLREVAERCMQARPVMVRRGKDMVQKVDEEGRLVWKFDSVGANIALKALGQHLGAFTENRNASQFGNIEVTVNFVGGEEDDGSDPPD